MDYSRPSRRGVSRNCIVTQSFFNATGRPSRRGVSRNSDMALSSVWGDAVAPPAGA